MGLRNVNRYRLKGIDLEGIGKNTIDVIGLNDVRRVITPRMIAWETLKERLIEIEDDLQDGGYKRKYKNRLQKIMENCLPDTEYAAVKATNLLNDESYKAINSILIAEGQWTENMKDVEKRIKEIALKLV